MAIDHFIKHKWQKDRADWNFNVLFNDQPQVAAYAAKYKPLLEHPGLYEPVPAKWLHVTVLRVGFVEDFSEEEMLQVADRLTSKFAALKMPEFLLGQWWIWGGNPCVHFTPDGPLNQVFDLLVKELTAVVGIDRLPALKFTPHITLAYCKTYDDEVGLFKQLEQRHFDAVPLRLNNLSLIKQRVENDYYVWNPVKKISLGQES